MTTKQQEEAAEKQRQEEAQKQRAARMEERNTQPSSPATEGKKALDALKEIFEKLRASNQPLGAPDYDAITKHLKTLEGALG